MKTTYFDLIEQSYYFPQEGFDIDDGYLTFHGVSLKYLIEKYGTPLRMFYLPKIGDQIKKSKNLFNRAIKANGYSGKYHFCYCTKCCHYHHVIGTAMKHGVNLETSSSFDIDLIKRLYKKGEFDKSTILVHNGFKTEEYLRKIFSLQDEGFSNSIIVLDSPKELDRIESITEGRRKLTFGIRMAIDEDPQSTYYTSRLGIRSTELIDFYNKRFKDNPDYTVQLLHFFVDSGIKDSFYYWGEFKKAVNLYTKLK
ncbi:MAG: arginine decarboxylase, partial [Candidatus Delongbacteria bacterium]|nr:arginine decarboxylase [Candidatus Delongbacteria bacterium]